MDWMLYLLAYTSNTWENQPGGIINMSTNVWISVVHIYVFIGLGPGNNDL